VFLSPRQKLLHGVHVGAARIFIANGAEEEFMRGEARVCPGAMNLKPAVEEKQNFRSG
jgi:hypothetical protein